VTEVSTAFFGGRTKRRGARASSATSQTAGGRWAGNDAGIPCGVMLAPILPALPRSGKMRMSVVAALTPELPTSHRLFHLRPGVKEVCHGMAPGQLSGSRTAIRRCTQQAAYASKLRPEGPCQTRWVRIIRSVPPVKKAAAQTESRWREGGRGGLQRPEQLMMCRPFSAARRIARRCIRERVRARPCAGLAHASERRLCHLGLCPCSERTTSPPEMVHGAT